MRTKVKGKLIFRLLIICFVALPRITFSKEYNNRSHLDHHLFDIRHVKKFKFIIALSSTHFSEI